MAISFLSQLGLIYIPLMQAIFQTEALPLDDLLLNITNHSHLKGRIDSL